MFSMNTSLAHVLELAPRLIKRGESPGQQLRGESDDALRWEPNLVRGRLVELSSEPGDAPLTAAFSMVRRFQREGEPVAWISARSDLFFSPDVAALGVALQHLPVIRVHQLQHAMRAACHILRSGGFGCAILDLGALAMSRAPQALLSRLTRIAQSHDATVLVLTDKPPHAPSMGSLVSLRLTARISSVGASEESENHLSSPGASGVTRSRLGKARRYRSRVPTHGPTPEPTAGQRRHRRLTLKALKDKSRAPGWTITEAVRGSASLP